jgi:2-polyprenyl-6-methoxyphenol hydroxylase-like FAD-dependent oxidoreductase
MSEPLHVLVAGGGIGGLCTAIALRRIGAHVTVLERQPRVMEVGAGLSLWPNATRALRNMGLADLVQRLTTASVEGGFFNHHGRLLAAGNTAALAAAYEDPTMIVHRGDLIDALHAEVPDEAIRCGVRCEGFSQDADGVELELQDSERVRGDVLVGADGIHSAIRRGLGHPSTPRYAGYTAWRGVMRLEDAGLSVDGDFWGLYVGAGSQCGLNLMSEGRVYWFATQNVPADGPQGAGGHKDELVRLFAAWPEALRAVFDATPDEAILRNDIVDLDPLSAWGNGRVTLLGDAAHATTPNMGQGACMAIEDAVVLAQMLHAHADVPTALRAYEDARLERTNRVVKQSRTFGRVFQLQNGFLCWLRDRMLAAAPVEKQLDRMRWVFEYDTGPVEG